MILSSARYLADAVSPSANYRDPQFSGWQMIYRILGSTGLRISSLAIGAGPVSGLMTGSDRSAQLDMLQRALQHGINWIDTAPGYGQGKSEWNLGHALEQFERPHDFHIATKVRIEPDHFSNIPDAIRRSLEESLNRLHLGSVTLLQLHNGITARRGEEPFSLTPRDALGEIADTFERLRNEGLIHYAGLTGTGNPEALREVIRSGAFDTIQVPYHLLNPSAGQRMPEDFAETNYGNIIADCTDVKMGVLAIRVFAGGAILGLEPSAHTRTTPFFPLGLYERDRTRAVQLGNAITMKEKALECVLSHPSIHAAIIGFGSTDHLDEACSFVEKYVPNSRA